MPDEMVLVVEDNEANMAVAAALLEASGYRFLQARSAEEGINLAKAQSPDLILMDISLPGMDGLTATRILTRDPETCNIPIVAVTAHAMKGDADKALAAGCIGYITKPIDTRAFAKALAGFLQLRPRA